MVFRNWFFKSRFVTVWEQYGSAFRAVRFDATGPSVLLSPENGLKSHSASKCEMTSWRVTAAADARAAKDGQPPHLCCGSATRTRGTKIWSEEKEATHLTAKPNEHGVFAEPVYYDWDRDWVSLQCT